MEMRENINISDSVNDTEDLFERIGTEGLSGEELGAKSLTYWADVWRRFKANKLAIFGLILLIAIILLLFLGPTISGKDYQYINAEIKNQHLVPSTGLEQMIWEEICLPVSVSAAGFRFISVFAVPQ